MTDRRSFVARALGALAGLVSAKAITVDAAETLPKSPAALGVGYIKPLDIPRDRKSNGYDPANPPKHRIKLVAKRPMRKNVLVSYRGDFDVYVDGVKVTGHYKLDVELRFGDPFAIATLVTYEPIPGVEWDEEHDVVKIACSDWQEFTYVGIRE